MVTASSVDTRKIELLTETRDTFESLDSAFSHAEIAGSVTAGRYPHDVLQMGQILGAASTYFNAVAATVTDPEIGRDYNPLRQGARARAARATEDARRALESISLETLQLVHDGATEALEGLERSVTHYAIALVQRPGQDMTDEDVANSGPLQKLLTVLTQTETLREAFRPDVSYLLQRRLI